MSQKRQDPWAEWADDALKQLPAKPAPARLTRRIMAQIEREAARPWYRRPWLDWPSKARLLSLTALGGLAAAAAYLGQPASEAAAEQVGQAIAFSSALESIGRAGLLCLANVHPWLLATVAAVVALSAAVTCGCGALCIRLSHQER